MIDFKTMPAGRLMDAYVSHEITKTHGDGIIELACRTGLKPFPDENGEESYWPGPAPYSTDIAEAFNLIEIVNKKNPKGQIASIHFAESKYSISYHVPDINRSSHVIWETVKAETIALAICRAALIVGTST